MATVEIQEFREQYAHFGLYRQNVGGDEKLIIRRKVGEPTDYMHRYSRAVQRQREAFAVASRHYASLTPSQKAKSRLQIRWVDYVKDHGQSDTKLLMGRQLFISEDVLELKTKGKTKKLPHEVCIILCDIDLNPLKGTLWLRYLEDELWVDCQGEELNTGNWLFTEVPPGKVWYRVEGWSPGYYDPKSPGTQFMSESLLLGYHYHILLSGMELVIAEPWTHELPPEPWVRIILEEWSG